MARQTSVGDGVKFPKYHKMNKIRLLGSTFSNEHNGKKESPFWWMLQKSDRVNWKHKKIEWLNPYAAGG